jgi:hypothetical protein
MYYIWSNIALNMEYRILSYTFTMHVCLIQVLHVDVTGSPKPRIWRRINPKKTSIFANLVSRNFYKFKFVHCHLYYTLVSVSLKFSCRCMTSNTCMSNQLSEQANYPYMITTLTERLEKDLNVSDKDLFSGECIKLFFCKHSWIFTFLKNFSVSSETIPCINRSCINNVYRTKYLFQNNLCFTVKLQYYRNKKLIRYLYCSWMFQSSSFSVKALAIALISKLSVCSAIVYHYILYV